MTLGGYWIRFPLHCLLTSLSSRLSLILERLFENPLNTLNILKSGFKMSLKGRWAATSISTVQNPFALPRTGAYLSPDCFPDSQGCLVLNPRRVYVVGSDEPVVGARWDRSC